MATSAYENLRSNMGQQGMLTSSGGFRPFDYVKYLQGMKQQYPWLYGAGAAEDVVENIGDIDFTPSSSDYDTVTKGPLSDSEKVLEAYNYYGLNDNLISGRNILSGVGGLTGFGLITDALNAYGDYSYGINPTANVTGMLGGVIGSKLGPDPMSAKTYQEYVKNMQMKAAQGALGDLAGRKVGEYATGNKIGDWYSPEYFADKYSSYNMPGSWLAERELGREFPELDRESIEFQMKYDDIVNQYTDNFAQNRGLTEEGREFLNKSSLEEGLDWKGQEIEDWTPYDKVAEEATGMLWSGNRGTYDVPNEGEREIWDYEAQKDIWRDQYRDEFNIEKNPIKVTPLTRQQQLEISQGPDPYGRAYESFGSEGDTTWRDDQGTVWHSSDYNWNTTDGGASDVVSSTHWDDNLGEYVSNDTWSSSDNSSSSNSNSGFNDSSHNWN